MTDQTELREKVLEILKTDSFAAIAECDSEAADNNADAIVQLIDPTDASIDDRMTAAGMFTLTEMLAEDPMGAFACHNAVRDLDSFKWWIESRHKQFLKMKMQYELGDKPKDDELYEWVFAHASVFGNVVANFRQATGGGE